MASNPVDTSTRRVVIPDGNTEPLTSELDGQVFVADRGTSSTVDGEPLLTIENDDVRVRNGGELATTGETATIEVNGDEADILNRRSGSIDADGTGVLVNGDDAELRNIGSIEGGVNGVSLSESSSAAEITNRGVLSSDSRALEIDGSGHEIVNSGSILGTGDQRNGTVYSDDTASDFSITNTRRGVIDAGAGNQGAGVSLSLDADGAGEVELDNDGVIAGRGDAAAGSALAGDGIRLESIREGGALVGNEALFEGEIRNSGQVSSEGANGTVGAFRTTDGVGFQGELVNERGGVFDGGQNGVYFGNGDHSGGEFNNLGLVTSDSRAVNIDGEGLSVRNGGEIIGTGNQRNGTVYADDTASDFSIVNTRRGVIDAGIGNEGAGISLSLDSDGPGDASLINNGQVLGRGDAAAGAATAGDGIRLESIREEGSLVGNQALFEGSIRNAGRVTSEGANGTVGAFRTTDGVDFQGSLLNTRAGTFAGGQNGVYFGNGDHSGGVFDNRGLVTSDSRAVNIDGEDLTVINSGEILGTGDQRNGTVYADDTASDYRIENSERGIIDAGQGNDGAAISLSLDEDGPGQVRIDNEGIVAGRGNASAGAATAGDGIRLEGIREGGALVGNEALFDGVIVNDGRVTSEGANGTVGAFRSVNGVDFQGRLVNGNQGEFAGVQNGVYFGTGDHTGGVFVNRGEVSSDSRAVNIDGEGLSVINRRIIEGTGDQRNGTLYADDTANNYSIFNARRGEIDAGQGNQGAGVSLSLGEVPVQASVNNDGLIQGRTVDGEPLAPTSALAGDGLRLEGVRGVSEGGGVTFADATFVGDISNSGTIQSGDNTAGSTAGFHAVNGVGFQGTLTNEIDGEISGASNGVYFGTGDHEGGLFENDGLVTSDSRAVNLDGEGLTVVNRGDILGTDDQRNGTFYADSTAEDYSLTNTESGVIDAGRGNEGSGVALQTGDEENDIVSVEFVNDGEIRGRGNSAEANQIGHGLRVFSGPGVEGTTTLQGDIVNGGLIRGAAVNSLAAGIIIEGGVTLDGEIVNNGTIQGRDIAIDTQDSGGPVTIVNNGEIIGDVLLGDGDDSFVVGNGSNTDGTVNGGEGSDTVDFSDLGEGATGGAFNGVIVDLDINSAGAAGTPSQDGAILDLPPAAGGQPIGDLDLDDIENVIGSDFNDGLFGNNEVNVLDGGAGNDLVHGFAGNDFLAGGEGTDTVLFSAAPAGVFVDLSQQVSQEDFDAIVAGEQSASFAATGGAGNNVLSGFENVTGSQSDDQIIGDNFANVLNGNGGADLLNGGGGNDTFISDALDTIDGGSGVDTVSFAGVAENATGGAFNGVIVDLDVNSAGAAGTPSQDGAILDLPPAAGGVQIGDLEVDDVENVIGSDFNDGLFGNNEVNVLDGGAGNDLVHGFAGDDFLAGGEGTDTVLFSAAPAGVEVDLEDQVSQDGFDAIVAGDESASFAATGGAGSNVLSGFENVTGSQSDDVISGDFADNVLNGNGGNDILDGRGGNDTLIGAGGEDSFVFTQGTGQDVVNDFGAEEDVLDVSDFGFNAVEDVLAAAEEVQIDGQLATTIDLDGNAGSDQVTLLGVAIDDLNSGNLRIDEDAFA